MYPVSSSAGDWYIENDERARGALRAHRVDYRRGTTLPFPASAPSMEIPRSPRERLKIIKRAVCEGAGISEEQLSGPCRKRETSRARAVFYHFSRRLTKASLTRIGLEVGRMDHATVVFGLRRVEHEPQDYARLMAYVRARVEFLERTQ